MKKYSVLKGAEVLAKFGIKKFGVTINSRAHRLVKEDGTIVCLSRDADFHCTTHYSFHHSQLIFTDSEVKVFSDESSIEVGVSQVKLFAEDNYIRASEIFAPILRISNKEVFFANRSVYSAYSLRSISDEQIWNAINDNWDVFQNSCIPNEKIELVFDMLKFFKDDFVQGSGTWVGEAISYAIKGWPKTNFFFSGEYKSYSLAIKSSVFGSTFNKEMKKIIDDGHALTTFDDILKRLDIPLVLKTAFENKSAKRFLEAENYWTWGVFDNLHLLANYPLTIQNILLHYAVGGDVNVGKLKEFLQYYQPDMFEKEEHVEAFRKFMIKDYRRTGIRDFKEFMERLEKLSLPVNSRTANIKFMSILDNRDNVTYRDILPDRLDVFEEMLEKDALKAFEYLTKQTTA